MNNIILTGDIGYWNVNCKRHFFFFYVCKGVRIWKANCFVLFYLTAQSRMENQHSSRRCFNNQLRQYKVETKTKRVSKELFSLKSTLFYFIFFFYNPGPPCQSLKAECKANCLNKPDYRYWTLQSVSPHIEKRLAPAVWFSGRSWQILRVWLSIFVASLLNGHKQELQGSSDFAPGLIRPPFWVGIGRVFQEAQWIVWEPFWSGVKLKSLAWWFSCMGTATVTTHTNTRAKCSLMRVCLSVQRCNFRRKWKWRLLIDQ